MNEVTRLVRILLLLIALGMLTLVLIFLSEQGKVLFSQVKRSL